MISIFITWILAEAVRNGAPSGCWLSQAYLAGPGVYAEGNGRINSLSCGLRLWTHMGLGAESRPGVEAVLSSVSSVWSLMWIQTFLRFAFWNENLGAAAEFAFLVLGSRGKWCACSRWWGEHRLPGHLSEKTPWGSLAGGRWGQGVGFGGRRSDPNVLQSGGLGLSLPGVATRGRHREEPVELRF